MKKAILLLSGGIDSATCGVIAKSQGFFLYAMSFRYGQRHVIELESASRVAGALDTKEHRIVDIDLRAFGGSALTDDIPVPRASGLSTDIPLTYVPARNTIFLSYALGWAEVLGITDIFIGANAVDYSGYPDCRPEYIAAYETMANLATRTGIMGNHINIQAPLMSLTKGAIIRTGTDLGFDYSLTHSCYDPSPEGFACGTCDSCAIRKNGFLAAGVKDPTVYQK
jgi:7-cyano-7-deazaguanine synthase